MVLMTEVKEITKILVKGFPIDNKEELVGKIMGFVLVLKT
jgi:hypothetical protein